MAGFGRYSAVLRLYKSETAKQSESWTVPAMAIAIGAPASTVYRTVRELTHEGFLEQASEASYRLGPAFIEFDRLLRLSDPLVRIGRSIMSDVVKQAAIPCVALMARLYNGEVMCVADEAAPGTAFQSSYERGRPMPLTRGATSKVILAHLPARQLGKLIGPKDANPALRQELRMIRRAGYFATASEIDTGLAGMAAPVIVEDLGIISSLTLVTQDGSVDDATRRRLILLLVSAANLIADEIRVSNTTAPEAEGLPSRQSASPEIAKMKRKVRP